MKTGNRKSRRGFLWVLAPIILLIATTMTAFYYQGESVERSRQLVLQTLSDSAAEQTAILSEKLNGQFLALEIYAAAIADGDTGEAVADGARMKSVCRASEFDRLIISDTRGSGVTETGESLSLSDWRSFREALAGERAIRPEETGDGHEAHFALSVPVVFQGRTVGVVTGCVSERGYAAAILSEAFSGAGFSYICDSEGCVVVGDMKNPDLAVGSNIFDMIDGETATAIKSDTDLREALASGQRGLAVYTVDGVARYAVHYSLGINDWVIVNAVPAELIDDGIVTSTLSGYIVVTIMGGLAILLIAAVVIMDRRRMKQLEREREELRVSEERFAIVMKAGAVYIREYDPRTRLVRSVEDDGEDVCTPQEAVERGYIHPEDSQRYLDMFGALDAGAPSAEGVFRVITKKSGQRYVRMLYTNLTDQRGAPYRAVGSYEDVTEKQQERISYEQELNYQRLAAPDMYSSALLDVTSGTVRRMDGRELTRDELPPETDFESLCARNAAAVAEDEDVRRFFITLTAAALEERFRAGQSVIAFEYLRNTAEGQTRWMREELHLLREPDSGHLMAFIFLKDIDEERRKLESLELAAETDAMTGFLNHNATLSHIGNFISLDGGGAVHAIFMIDIDNFKQVNDTFGHLVGDECIRQVAAGLRGLFRLSDILGRVGGDEFLVLMKNVGSTERARRKAHEVVESLSFAYTSAGTSMQVSVSLGVCVVTSGGRVGDLVAKADAALYEAKKGGKNRFVLCESGEPSRSEEPSEAESASNRAGLIQFQALLEYMDSGVELLELGCEIRQIYVSPGFCRMMGVRQEDYTLPRTLRDVRVHPDDLEDCEAALRAGAEWGDVVDHVFRSGSDGAHWHWRHARAVRIPYEQSQYPVLIAVVSDIDELKRQEAELDFSEQRYRTALAKTGATIWEMDLRSGEVYRMDGGKVMEKELRLFDGGAEALAVSGLVHPDSLPEFRRMISNIRSGDDGGSYSLLTKAGDGEYVWGVGRFALLREADGKPYYAIGVLEHYPDLGQELERFTRELRLSGEIANSLKAMCRVNLTRGEVEQFALNDGQYNSTETSDYEKVHALIPEFLAPDEDRRDELMEASRAESFIADFRSGRFFRLFEFRRLSSDGSSRWTSCSVILTSHPVSGDVYAFTYMRDIDQRRRWELASGAYAVRDEESLLFTAESARALIESIRDKAPDGGVPCALCVIELYRLREIRAEKGFAAAAAVSRSVGRLLRMLIDGGAIVGRLDENHAIIFRVDAGSAGQEERRAEELNARVVEICRLMRVDFYCRLISGVELRPIGELDYDAALARAMEACRKAVERAEKSVMLSSD